MNSLNQQSGELIHTPETKLHDETIRNGDITEIARGRFIRLVKKGTWEYVSRVNCSGVVTALPLTEDNELVLVKQFRIPVDRETIEFPSGLIGDEDALEDAVSAAERELFEESGYGGGNFRFLGRSSVSPGLTDETVSYVLATGLKKQGIGGGVGNERISVITVPIEEIDSFLAENRARGITIDRKVEGGIRELERFVEQKRNSERFSPILNRVIKIDPARFTGSLYGTAIGDALGLPVETMTASEIRSKHGRVDSFLPPDQNKWISATRLGTTSDDTALTLALLDAFATTKGYDRDAVALFHGKALRNTPEGWGKSSVEGVKRITSGGEWDGRSVEERDGLGTGNGIAMKIAPVAMHAVLAETSLEELVSTVKDIAMATHPTGLGMASGLAQAAGVYYCLANDSTSFDKSDFIDFVYEVTSEALKEFPDDKETLSLLNRVDSLRTINLEDLELISNEFGGGDCYALNSVPFTLAYFLRNPTSAKSIIDVVNGGGDTDSNGSMVGALVGALNGNDALQRDLIDQLPDSPKIIGSATRFFKQYGIKVS